MLRFDIAMTATAGLSLTTILPPSYGGQALRTVTAGGITYTPTVLAIKSISAAFVSIPAGTYNGVTALYTSSTQLPQTITVVNHAPASAAYGASFTVSATASSGLAVTTVPGACTNTGNTFTLTSGTGTCTVRYDQAGNANYNAATQVTETVTAQKAPRRSQ